MSKIPFILVKSPTFHHLKTCAFLIIFKITPTHLKTTIFFFLVGDVTCTFFWPASWSCLFSFENMRCMFLSLDTLMFLSYCAVVHWVPFSLSVLVRKYSIIRAELWFIKLKQQNECMPLKHCIIVRLFTTGNPFNITWTVALLHA